MNENRVTIRKEIDNWFELHSNELIRDLEKLIAIRSIRGQAEDGAPYGPGPRAVLSAAQKMLETRGFAVDEFEDIIITADLGPAPPLLGILAHLDVVDPGAGWDTDPFKLAQKDGKLYGRGATDNKGPAIAAMYAMYCARDICPEFKHGVQILLGSGEESGCEDILQYLKKVKPPTFVFTPDSDFPVVNVEKGRFVPFFGAEWDEDGALPRVKSINGGTTINSVPSNATATLEGLALTDVEAFCREHSAKTGAEITAKSDGDTIQVLSRGKAAHAAYPQGGLNALTALVAMLSAMPFAESVGFEYIRAINRLFPHGDWQGRGLELDMRDELTGPLTLNLGVLDYTSSSLSANFDSRTPAVADEVDLVGITRDAFSHENLSLKDVTISKCHHTPEDTPFVQSLLQIYEEYTGNSGKCLSIGGSTYVHDIPGGVAFGCEFPGVDCRIHGANEFIGYAELILSAKMFTQAILDAANGFM